MSMMEQIALSVFAIATVIMLLVTQTKQRVDWPAWLIPVVFGLLLAGWTGYAIFTEQLAGLWTTIGGSAWGVLLWSDRLMSTVAAFFLLQNRARSAGMKSETWVIIVIFTGSIGLLLMLARTVYLERKNDLLTSKAPE